MVLRSFPAATLLALLATGAQLSPAMAQDRPASAEDVLERHAEALGGAGVLRASGDIERRGTLEAGGDTFVYRGLIRRSPFAVREEFAREGSGEAPKVYVCNGERAWRLFPDGRGQPLSTEAAVSMLDHMLVDRLLLDPAGIAVHGLAGAARSLPPADGWPPSLGALPPGSEVDTLVLHTAAGAVWRCFFDGQSGRLVGMDNTLAATGRWTRFAQWTRHGDLTLPALQVEGSNASPALVLTIDEVRTGRNHPDELFAGDPQPPRPRVEDISPLYVAASAVPGSAYLVVPEVRLNGAGPFPALLDTGVDSLYLEASLPERLGLPLVALSQPNTQFGRGTASMHWLDALQVGRAHLVQVRAGATRLPGIPEVPASGQPKVLLGGWPLLRASPVLDLKAGRLLLRGDPPVALEDVAPIAKPRAGRAVRSASQATGEQGDEDQTSSVFRIPLWLHSTPGSAPAIEVGMSGHRMLAVLDTGAPHTLRLAAGGLRRLGLPTSREAWMKLGAIPYPAFGAGGTRGTDLLARLAELEVGPVVYERPYVLLAGLGDHAEAIELSFEGLLGVGALLPFDRVGIHGGRGELELEPGPSVVLTDHGRRCRVPAPGSFLGLFLSPPDPGATSEPGILPRIYEVLHPSPAARAGLLPGDRLLAIDGIPCHLQPPAALHRRLWPAPGTQVVLALLREAPDGTVFTVRLP